MSGCNISEHSLVKMAIEETSTCISELIGPSCLKLSYKWEILPLMLESKLLTAQRGKIWVTLRLECKFCQHRADVIVLTSALLLLFNNVLLCLGSVSTPSFLAWPANDSVQSRAVFVKFLPKCTTLNITIITVSLSLNCNGWHYLWATFTAITSEVWLTKQLITGHMKRCFAAGKWNKTPSSPLCFKKMQCFHGPCQSWH